MFSAFRDWLDQRSGYRRWAEILLIEHIPGGARWRYVWGSCLAFVFTVQLLTGILLMTSYSPGDSTAWSSVYFIQYQMDFGWFIRGIHHFGSQMMVVLLAIHMLQVVIAGAHLPPREINWWLGLVLLALILGLSLTGYLLPWDQKGYWATQVATNIAGNLPVAGPWLQKVIVGGPAYGHETLTRFYTLHVGILPPLVIAFLIAHVTLFRRHGVKAPLNAAGKPRDGRPDGWFWPEQAFKDMVVSLILFGILVGLVLWGHGQSTRSAADAGDLPVYQRWAHAGQDGMGANLDAPADPSTPYPARPEWYFLFLFQLLKYFEGEQEIIGTVVIPTAVGGLLFVLPLLGMGRLRRFGHLFGVAAVVAVLGGAAVLTYQALAADRAETDSAKKFREEQKDADELAARAVRLAGQGIPPGGASSLLRRDPLTSGPKQFISHCGSCHTHGALAHSTSASASDLAGFGTGEWILGLLRNPGHEAYFGRTKLTTMRDFIETNFAADDEKAQADLLILAGWLGNHPRATSPDRDSPAFQRGQQVFSQRQCNGCHAFEGKGGTRKNHGPDLTGYGDADWIRLMIMAPYDSRRYGMNNSMPVFRDLESLAGPVVRAEMAGMRDLWTSQIGKDDREAASKRQAIDHATVMADLTDLDRELIIRMLLKDDHLVFGGEPISSSKMP